MFNVNQFDWKKENGLYSGIAEASQLGLAPGEWPSVLIVEGKTGNRLFHDDTLPHPVSMRAANERGHVYSDGRGCSIHILND